MSLEDYLKQATADILQLLLTKPKTNLPTLHIGDETKQAIADVATILNRATNPPKPMKTTRKAKVIKWKTPIATTIIPPSNNNVAPPRVKHSPTSSPSETTALPQKEKSSVPQVNNKDMVSVPRVNEKATNPTKPLEFELERS